MKPSKRNTNNQRKQTEKKLPKPPLQSKYAAKVARQLTRD